ncbi:MAG: HNH endonuclease [Methylococcaceae bacterium]|nr:HNH endonuclease [Methylococcaceae bacterium]
MEIIKNRVEILDCIARFKELLNNETYIGKGYTIYEFPGSGRDGNGVKRHYILLRFAENGKEQTLLEINIPYEYNKKIGAIRGRIAADVDGHYILRSTIGMAMAGRINIRKRIEDDLSHRIVNIDDRPWINICNIDDFDIDRVIEVLQVIRACKDEILFPPEEIFDPGDIVEGARQTVIVNKYERDAVARRACIEHWGVNCNVCGFSFKKQYGDYGSGFIHVHHLKPLAEIGEEYHLNAIKDMRPVCPNCHAMLHRSTPALTIDALRRILSRTRKPS